MPLDNFGVLRAGALYRCAQPDARGLGDLAALGVTKIVRLSSPFEGLHEMVERGIFPGEVISRDVPMCPTADQLRVSADIVERMVRNGHRVAVHCYMGRDRTGAVLGTWRVRHDAWSFAAMMDEREIFGAGALIDATIDSRLYAALREACA